MIRFSQRPNAKSRSRARVCRPFVEAYERAREERYSYADKLEMDFVTYCDRVHGIHLKSLYSSSITESIAQAFRDISDLMRSGESLQKIRDMAEHHFSTGVFDGDVFRVEYGKHRDGYYPKGVSIEVYLNDDRKNIVWHDWIMVDDSCKTAERVLDRIDREIERVSDSWDDFRHDEIRRMTRSVSERRKCRRNFESILSSRSPRPSEYSSLMAEPTRQLLYSLTDVVENRVKETLSSIAKDVIPAPYADYDGETYSTTEISVKPSEKGLLISTGYPSYLSMDFSIRILETDDSLQTLQNSYSIPKTFTLSISYGRNHGVEMDIMDFTRSDMNEIAQYIADSVAEEVKNSIDSQGLKHKKNAVTVEWLAYAIQFEYDRNRRKKGGRVVKRDGTNSDFAFLEIPSVGDLLIQDLADSIQFTLYKHGYKKELKSFTMSKAELSRDSGSSSQAIPVLDRLLNEQ